jgi:uncharacterized phage protein (TIGR02218 family)
MTRGWFAGSLETVATWWRIERTDGVAMGFVSHDRDLAFAGVVHRSAPGMVPSAIRMSADLEPDSAEISGSLSHDAIREDELSIGRFDGARVATGLVDWITMEYETIYSGTIGAVSRDGKGFSAELESLKALLDREPVVRTAPTCRAEFCGPGCTLSAPRFTHDAEVLEVSADRASLKLSLPVATSHVVDGTLRWLDGPDAGVPLRIEGASGDWVAIEREIDLAIGPGARAEIRAGCDHTLEACSSRFDNAINFQGEPFLPGNDLLTRYPSPQQ